MTDIEKFNLETLLTEYKFLRNQFTNRFDHQIKIFSIIVSALGIIYGIIFGYRKYDIISLIPIFLLPLALRFQYENYGVEKTGEYLVKVEKQIRMIIRNPSWEGWQNHWENKLGTERDWNILIYDIFSKWLLFILIPVGMAIFYSFVVIFRGIESGVSPILNELISDIALITCFHKILLIVYVFGFIFTFIHFIIRKYLECMKKKKNENKKNKRNENKKKGTRYDLILSGVITAIFIIIIHFFYCLEHAV